MEQAPHQMRRSTARRLGPSDSRTGFFSARYPFVIIPENIPAA
jgi:hypothetical protein